MYEIWHRGAFGDSLAPWVLLDGGYPTYESAEKHLPLVALPGELTIARAGQRPDFLSAVVVHTVRPKKRVRKVLSDLREDEAAYAAGKVVRVARRR